MMFEFCPPDGRRSKAKQCIRLKGRKVMPGDRVSRADLDDAAFEALQGALKPVPADPTPEPEAPAAEDPDPNPAEAAAPRKRRGRRNAAQSG